MVIVETQAVRPEHAEPALMALVEQLEQVLAHPGAPVVPGLPRWVVPQFAPALSKFLAQWAPRYPGLPPELVERAVLLAALLEARLSARH
jgi:tRNA U34 5-methylaminomethyl-2-thiouridine-forming methyltransferase MnmC